MAETKAASTDPIHFAKGTLSRNQHVCAFFRSEDEEYRVLLPFIREGFELNEKAFHIVDPKLRGSHLERLESGGIKVKETQQTGQLEVRNWEDAYLRDGHFDQYRMLALIERVFAKGGSGAFALTRLVAHMEWALEDRPGVNDLVEYETRLNQILPKYADPVICAYDTVKFGGGIMVDIMRTHPMIIIGGVLQENPFFVPPDEFLGELQERATGRGSATPQPALV
jgi:hypothetical protein